MRTITKKLTALLTPGGLLTGLFLAGMFYISLAGVPTVMYELGNALYHKTGVSYAIDSLDEYYSGMLTTEKDQPLLHNKGSYINLNGLMAKILGQPAMNERITLKNGHLSFDYSVGPEEAEIREAADNVVRLSRQFTREGKHFLLVMASSQLSKYQQLLPAGYRDAITPAADRFLALLEEEAVDCLDLREQMELEGISVTDAYYTTDHHWKPETGFWAYTRILQKLEQMGAAEPVDAFYTDPNNFTFESHPETFLGSGGKRTGLYYAGLDSSTYIRPNFETDISLTVEDRQLNLRGRYEDVCYNTEVPHSFTDPDYYHDSFYALYGWGDTPLTRWRNHSAPQSGKYLLIGDSFGNVPFSLLSVYLESCDEMDMRYFTEDFAAYCAGYDPDTVILLINVDMVTSPFTADTYFSH